MLDLLIPPVRCPKCRRRPGMRLSKWLQQLVKDAEKESIVQTYGCAHCGEMYALTVRDVLEAK